MPVAAAAPTSPPIAAAAAITAARPREPAPSSRTVRRGGAARVRPGAGHSSMTGPSSSATRARIGTTTGSHADFGGAPPGSLPATAALAPGNGVAAGAVAMSPAAPLVMLCS